VSIRGSFFQVREDGEFQLCVRNENVGVDAVFFYGPNSGTLAAEDEPAIAKLCATGINASGVPLYIVVDRIMLEACRRGLMTNALGKSRGWGPKHQQEWKLRRYEMATGSSVIRPETYVAQPWELARVLSIFAAQSETCLIKPALGEGGEGLHIVHPGETFPRLDYLVVVQRLVPDPLLVDGNKADLRWYLLIDVNDRQLSKRLRPVFVRRASIPYLAETEEAEITNTAYRVRQGLSPDMRPLAPMPGISQSVCDEITSQLDSLAHNLLDAFFWDLTHSSGDTTVPNRMIIFGIDALVAVPQRLGPRVYFLETNPFPAFFRGLRDCDLAVEEMLSTEYLPALIKKSVDDASV
jgi:hypothetical protein